MTKTLLMIFFSLLINFQAHAEVRVYFSPSTDCETQIVDAINHAQNTLDIVIYSLTNDKITDAIINAHNRGVNVRILADRLQASGRFSMVAELYRRGLNIRVHSVHKIEHNKIAVIDDSVFITGSYNWTTSATNNNSENCVFLSENQEVISKVKKRVDDLWKANSKAKSDAWFNKKL